jgi:5-carboxymethyl-2-hydroxymuconate isomerase
VPHLRFEVDAELARALDWSTLTREIHRDLASRGWAALDDLKSRVVVCAFTAAGDLGSSQQIVVTLITTNPRPPEVRRAMTACVLAHLERAVTAIGPRHWTQCCVFLQATDRSDYAKVQWNPPPRSNAPDRLP